MTWQEDTEVVREGIFAGYANDEDDAIARGQVHAALVRLTAALEAAEERIAVLDMIDPEPLDEYALAGLRAQPIHPDDVELDSWLQRAKAAERERRNAEDRANASDLVREKWQARAEAAEQRIEELEEALREIAKPFSSFDPKPQAIARAALSASESGEA